MLALKSNVKLRGLRPEMIVAYMVTASVYADHDYPLIITSANDSGHGHGSLHFQGAALDYRIADPAGKWAIPKMELEIMVNEIKERLNGEFDTILESNHIHQEYQPKSAD